MGGPSIDGDGGEPMESSREGRGYYLWEWQASGNTFASPFGFGGADLSHLLSHLVAFTTNEHWDPSIHKACFGVEGPRRLHGEWYWPSFSFTELGDKAIEGFGERPLSDSLALALAELKAAEETEEAGKARDEGEVGGRDV